MKHIVSVSLGCSSRDHVAELTIGGERILIERVGTNGSMAAVRQRFLELDQKVDAFGLGGGLLGISFGARYYHLRCFQALVKGLRTPVADGSALRAVVESQIAQYLDADLINPPRPRRLFMCTVAARNYHMAASFKKAGYDAVYGDIALALGVPISVRSLKALGLFVRIWAPVISRLPWALLNAGMDRCTPVYCLRRWYSWATVIAGDSRCILANLPTRLDGKIVVTNSTTERDLDMLREAGVAYLCTTTPRIGNRTFGTNVIEASLIALSGKSRLLTPLEIRGMLQHFALGPQITLLAGSSHIA